jgi:flagellin-specific chaperone FliS
MMDNRAATTYQQASAGSASPIGVIVALYDTILRDFRRELNHVLTVIAHLRSVLKYEGAKEAATRFERFYDVTRAMTLVANVQASPKPIEELIELYSSLRAAWYQAEQQLPLLSQQPAAPVRASSQPPFPTADPASGFSETLRPRWSA